MFFRSSVLPFFGSSVGLTLVELMVATSILAIGIVLVARALLTASVALDSVENRIKAFQFLEARMIELQQQARQAGGVGPRRTSGTSDLNHRPATWVLEIVPVELEDTTAQEGAGEPQETQTPSESQTAEEAGEGAAPQQGSTSGLTEVRLTLSWQEVQRKQDVVLVTYLGQQQAQEPES